VVSVSFISGQNFEVSLNLVKLNKRTTYNSTQQSICRLTIFVTCITASFLTLLFVALTSDFEMASPLDYYVLKYRVGHTVPPYSSRFMGCNYGS
jgi:hypothetical protein